MAAKGSPPAARVRDECVADLGLEAHLFAGGFAAFVKFARQFTVLKPLRLDRTDLAMAILKPLSRFPDR